MYKIYIQLSEGKILPFAQSISFDRINLCFDILNAIVKSNDVKSNIDKVQFVVESDKVVDTVEDLERALQNENV